MVMDKKGKKIILKIIKENEEIRNVSQLKGRKISKL